MEISKNKKFFLFSSLLLFLIYFITLILNFKIYFLPVTFLFIGFAIRFIFRSNYLIIFSFLFPIVSGFAFFENKGFPFNYLLLPLIMFVGIYIGEFFVDKNRAFNILNDLDKYYQLFLLIILISFIFVILKWSNLTIASFAFLKDTPISLNDNRFSFGIIFPILYLTLFYISYIYHLYLKKNEIRRKIIIAFLLGHSLSVVISFFQNFFKLELFLGHKPFNGLASDASSFGFLSSISLLLSVYIISKYKDKFYGILFASISFLGIVNSKSRIALIAVLFVVILFFTKLKKVNKIIFLIISLFGVLFFIHFSITSKSPFKLGFINEIVRSIKVGQEVIEKENFNKKTFYVLSAGRSKLWIYSFDIIKKYPLIGVGVGNYVFWVMNDQYGKKYHHDLPCNQFFFFSSSIGIMGMLIFIFFLINIMRKKRGIELYILICVLIIMFFGNYLWFPESFLAFWLILSLGEEKQGIKVLKNKKYYFLIYGVIIVVFIILNIYHFNDLHPKTWAKNAGTDYDYGFWYKEKSEQGENFKWTKDCAGQYIYLDKKGESRDIKLLCEAPLHNIKGKQQRVEIYWKRRLYKKIVFRENREVKFKIKDNPFEEGFLEIRVHPCFNLKRMNLSEESRDLGVQFFTLRDKN